MGEWASVGPCTALINSWRATLGSPGVEPALILVTKLEKETHTKDVTPLGWDHAFPCTVQQQPRCPGTLVKDGKAKAEAASQFFEEWAATAVAMTLRKEHRMFVPVKLQAAPGPSRVTAVHIWPIIESDLDPHLHSKCAACLVGERQRLLHVHHSVRDVKPFFATVESVMWWQATRCESLSLARAQSLTDEVEDTTWPFQFAFSTTAGCECVTHQDDALRVTQPGVWLKDPVPCSQEWM